MNHLKPYKMYENVETSEMTFKTYFDKMSIEDRIKSDALLEKDPRRWTQEEKSFMKRMSMKNVTLYIGSDGKIYTKDQVERLGYNVDDKPKVKHVDFVPDVTVLIEKYKEISKLSSRLSEKYKEQFNFTKIVNPIKDNLDMAAYNLNKLI